MNCEPGGVDFEYDDLFSTNFTQTDCNCSIAAHIYHELCSCDYPEEEPAPISESLPLGLFYGVVFVVGTLGNFLVVFVVNRFKRMHSVTNVFLASLSIADMFLVLFCVPVQFLKYLSYTWYLGAVVCYSLHYVQGFTMHCSILTLTAMSVERYIAIVLPMRAVVHTVGRAKRIVAVLWLGASVLALPTGFGTTYVAETSVRNRTAYWCMRREGDYAKWFSVYQFVVVLVLPAVTMIFCYANIARILYFSGPSLPETPRLVTADSLDTNKEDGVIGKIKPIRRPPSKLISASVPGSPTVERKVLAVPNHRFSLASSSHEYTTLSQQTGSRERFLRKSSKGTESQTRKQVIQMLLAIVILFIACWSPYVIDDLLAAFGLLCRNNVNDVLKYLRMVFCLCAYSNSCVNPIVYAFMSRNFRQTFRLAYQRLFLSQQEWQAREYFAQQQSAYMSVVVGRRPQLPNPTTQQLTLSPAVRKLSTLNSSHISNSIEM